MSTTAVARAGSREPARAYPGWAEPARRDRAVCSACRSPWRPPIVAPGTFLTGYVSTSPVAVSVRIEQRSKRRFDRIRAELASALGRDVTLSEFFEVLADVADEERERLMARAAGVRLPLSARDKAKVLSTGSDWGRRTSPEDIDHFLYGKPLPRKARSHARGRGG